MSETQFTRRKLADSPWFWAHLFCVAGLIAIFLMQPKYGARQAQLERQFQGRQNASQIQPGEVVDTPFSNAEDTLIKLGPLFWFLSLSVILTWGGLWWTHFRRSPHNSSVANSVRI